MKKDMNMKRYITTGLLLASFTAGMSACDDDVAEVVTPSLEVNEKVLSFDEETTQKLTIEANGRWDVKAIKDSANFIITPAEGTGHGEVTITLDRVKAEPINGYLKITYLDGTDEGLQVARGVKLTAPGLDMRVAPRNITFIPQVKYTEAPVRVEWAGQWTAELSDTTWYSLDRTSGEGFGEVNVRLKEKAYKKAKEVELYIIPAEYPKVKVPVKIGRKIDDFQNGKYVTLNKASVGKGIDIVFVGDGFTAEDMKEGGKWQQSLDTINTYMFEIEPFKSYRNHFNVYAIAHPFEGSLYVDTVVKTPLCTYDRTQTSVDNALKRDLRAISEYAFKNTPVSAEKENFSQMVVCLWINADASSYGGVCSTNMAFPQDSWCMAIAPCGIFADFCKRSIFTHELLGHGFGGFLDEYFSGNKDFPEEGAQQQMGIWKERGVNMNVCYSDSDPERIPANWFALSQLDEYKDYVGFWEGAFNHGRKIWRSTNHSVMNSHGVGGGAVWYGYYSPVQREILLSRIYKLSGREEEYSLQTFLDWDVINRETDIYYKALDTK